MVSIALPRQSRIGRRNRDCWQPVQDLVCPSGPTGSGWSIKRSPVLYSRRRNRHGSPGSESTSKVSSRASRSSGLIATAAGRPLRVMVTRSCVPSTHSTIEGTLLWASVSTFQPGSRRAQPLESFTKERLKAVDLERTVHFQAAPPAVPNCERPSLRPAPNTGFVP